MFYSNTTPSSTINSKTNQLHDVFGKYIFVDISENKSQAEAGERLRVKDGTTRNSAGSAPWTAL